MSELSTWGEKTKFFYELTPDIILNTAEKHGFTCTGRCNALNSMENRVYEIEIDSNSDIRAEHFIIMKFYRPGRWTKEQIQEEHDFIFGLQEVDIPGVAPVKTDGVSVFELDFKDADLKIYYSIFPKIMGRNPQELIEEQLSIVGRLLARMHNVGQEISAKHRIKLTPQTYGEQSLSHIQNVIPDNVRDRYLDLAEEICDISTELFQKYPSQLVHGDCHFGNLILSDQGFYWVDFDDCVIAPPVQDLWLLFPSRDEYSQDQLETLIKAYEEMRPFNWDSLELIESLRALRMIHFTAWISKRWDDPAFKKAFVEFGTPKYWNEQIFLLHEQLEFI